MHAQFRIASRFLSAALVATMAVTAISLAHVRPNDAATAASATSPSITVIPYRGSYTGSMEIRGTGFTPGSLITVVIRDGNATNPMITKSTAVDFAEDGEISVLFPLDALAKNDTQTVDPAMVMRTGMAVRNGCDQRDLVQAYDPTLDLWTPAIHVQC